MTVKTGRVQGRRKLRFETLDDVLRDAEAMAARPHRMLGNFTFGQVCAHLAILMEYSLDGFPDLPIPLVVRLLGRLFRPVAVRMPIPAGTRPPAAVMQAFAPPAEVSIEEGLSRLRTAIRRLQSEPQRHPSPLLGRLGRDDWDRVHRRHAELHLSFVAPE
jgi:hypothetical protein